MSDIRKALEALESVLCDPEGKAGIHGSDADMKIIDDALDQLRADLAQPQAAQPEANEEIQELRAQVEAWRKQCETLTNQVICCGVAARHPDATLTTRGAYAGKWNSPQAEEVRKLRAERDALLAAAPQPEPSAQAVAHPSHQTVREWMPVSEALRLSDLWTAGDLDNCAQWRAAIKVLADEVRALAASPQPEPSAQGEPVAWISPKDRVPKGGEVVLCLFRDKGIHTALFRGTSTTHGVFEAWHGFLVADLPTDRVIGWVPLASAPSTPPHAVVEAGALLDVLELHATFNRWAVHQVQEHEAIVPGEPEAPNVGNEATAKAPHADTER